MKRKNISWLFLAKLDGLFTKMFTLLIISIDVINKNMQLSTSMEVEKVYHSISLYSISHCRLFWIRPDAENYEWMSTTFGIVKRREKQNEKIEFKKMVEAFFSLLGQLLSAIICRQLLPQALRPWWVWSHYSSSCSSLSKSRLVILSVFDLFDFIIFSPSFISFIVPVYVLVCVWGSLLPITRRLSLNCRRFRFTFLLLSFMIITDSLNDGFTTNPFLDFIFLLLILQ